MLARISADPSLSSSVALTVPRMGFELTSMTYDGARKINTLGRNVKAGTTGLKKQYNPVPYNYDFSLYIFVKNAEDGTQILEQVLPFFTPEFTITMDLVSGMDVKMDIPLVLSSVSSEDTYEGDFATRRSIIWTLSFSMKGFLYPNVVDNAKVITSSVVDTHLMSEAAAAEPIYIVSEDSTVYSKNFMILDSHAVDTSTRIRLLTEASEDASSAGATVARVTVAPEDTTAITDEDFGCASSSDCTADEEEDDNDNDDYDDEEETASTTTNSLPSIIDFQASLMVEMEENEIRADAKKIYGWLHYNS
jgi:hypothetical protein